MKCAVFSCIGLGDGLLALVLSNNLARNGHSVDTYHPFLGEMQELFPHLPLLSRKEGTAFLKSYDRLFIVYEKLDWMQNILERALRDFPDKVTVLNPIATPNKDYPFWEGGRFDGSQPFVDNLAAFCRDSLYLEDVVKDNGIILPKHVKKHSFPRRVIIHPTSSRPGKNWSKGKFLSLAKRLELDGFEPVFILTEEEKVDWPEVDAPSFPSLCDLTYFVAESGAMVGNDSGIGHLASCMGLPTLTICRSRLAANFWRPAWAKGEVVVPPHWIPNLKGMRWRDQKWQHFVPVKTVERAFYQAIGE
ncbi:MAG: hypothetical protein KR126chlam1_00469 [Chlamydiae bacterium]|nr:hypothetical protein [Chlamydiota bacterium]